MSTMSEPLLRINNLSISFRKDRSWERVIHHVALSVERGKVLGIVGESGSGKTVSSLACMGLLPPVISKIDSGEVLFDGHNLLADDFAKAKDARGRRITMIFQEPMSSLNPSMRCGEQVAEALRQSGLHSGDVAARTVALFREVKLPDPQHIGRRYPHELSGGQKQRVMIAMALAPDPELIIADEPTTALDVTVQLSILALLRQLQQERNLAMLFISHDLDVVARVSDYVAVMWQGEVVERGTAADVLTQPKHAYTRGLLRSKPPEKGIRKRLQTVQDTLEHRAIPEHIYVSMVSEKPLLSVRRLQKSFVTQKNFLGTPVAFFEAVKDVSFDLLEGETLGLVGESGCGKSTVSRIIMGLLSPDAGELQWKKEALKPNGSPAVQLVFQDPYASLNPRKSAGSCLTEALQVSGQTSSAKEAKEKAKTLLKDVGLDEDAFDKYPHSFSGGQRQRLVIARALCTSPKLLILDESVAALDVSVQAQILNLLNDLKEKLGLTFLFISHDLNVVRFMSDRVLVMKSGIIVERGTAEKIFKTPEHTYTKELLQSTKLTAVNP